MNQSITETVISRSQKLGFFGVCVCLFVFVLFFDKGKMCNKTTLY